MLFLQSSELGLPHPLTCSPNWDSPTPSPAGECAPPLDPGKGHIRLRGGDGGVPSPNSDEGQTRWYSRYICTLWLRLSNETTMLVSAWYIIFTLTTA
jgi:hypothetical protein